MRFKNSFSKPWRASDFAESIAFESRIRNVGPFMRTSPSASTLKSRNSFATSQIAARIMNNASRCDAGTKYPGRVSRFRIAVGFT